MNPSGYLSCASHVGTFKHLNMIIVKLEIEIQI